MEGYAYPSGSFVVAEGPDLLKVRCYCYWWEIIPSGGLSSTKRIVVGYLSGTWAHKCSYRFGWWLFRLEGGVTSAEGLCDWERWVVPLFNYTLTLALKLRKNTEERRLGRRIVRLHVGPASLSFEGQSWLVCWEFTCYHLGTSVSPPSHKCLTRSELRGSPHQLSFSRSSESVLWCGGRKIEFWNPRENACYQRTKLC
jgi:hypothetical protein